MKRFHAMRPPASAGNLSERSDGVTLGGGAEGEKKWWLDPGSNRGHTDFQSVALPTELRYLKMSVKYRSIFIIEQNNYYKNPFVNLRL